MKVAGPLVVRVREEGGKLSSISPTKSRGNVCVGGGAERERPQNIFFLSGSRNGDDFSF